MTERIVMLSDEILGLTIAQSDRLTANDVDGVNTILDRRAGLIDELGRILETRQLPAEARRVLDEAVELSEAQLNMARVKQSELSLEFTNAKRSYQSIGAYEQSSIDSVSLVGAYYDLNT